MDMSKRTVFHRWLAGWLVLTLLFAQAATAAYACPLGRQGESSRLMADCTEMARMANQPAPGTGMDAAQPNLCKAHCDTGKQSLNPAVGVDFSHGVVLLGCLDWSCSPASTGDLIALHIGARSGAPPGATPGTPPLYIALQVLRI